MKKLLIIITALLCFIAPSVSASDAYDDNALDKLMSFEIIREGDNINGILSRGELAKYVLRMAAIDPEAFPVMTAGFNDVEPTHSNYSYISAVSAMGWMNGSGNGDFNPDENVDKAMLAKLMLCITGYEPMAAQKGGYPIGYITVASGLGIFDNCSIDGSSISTADAMQVFLNTLEIPVMQAISYSADGVEYNISEGLTVLEDRHKIYTLKGVVQSDEYSSIYGSPTVGDGEFKVGNTVLKGSCDYLGYRVECYYREVKSGVRESLYVAPVDNENIIIVDAKDIVKNSVTQDKFAYMQKNKIKNVNIGRSTSLIVNGRQQELDKDKLCPSLGYVTLINNDSDSAIDVIRVTSYETLIFDAYLKFNEQIRWKDGSLLALNDDDRDVIIYLDGKKADAESLAPWYIALAAQSTGAGKNISVLYISSKSVEGAVSEYGEEYAVIGGESYDISEQISQTIDVGMTGTFYMDINGRIAAQKLKRDSVYGYICGMDKDNFGHVRVKIFTENNRWVILDLSKNVSTETGRKTAIEVYNSLNSVRELVRYNVNDKREVYRLERAQNIGHWTSDAEGAHETDKFRLSMSLPSTTFREATTSFENQVILSGETKVFFVPTGGNGSDDEFSIGSLNSFVGDEDVTNVSVYDMSPYGIASVCVIEGRSPSINRLTNIMVVCYTNQASDDVGETYSIEGIYKGYKMSLKTADKSVLNSSDLPVSGDIIQFTTDNKGRITAVSTLYKAANLFNQKFVADSEYASASFFAGEVLKVDTENSLLTLDYGSGKGVFNLSKRLERIVIYDPVRRIAQAGSIADIDEGAYCFGRYRYYQANEIVVFKTS